MQVRKELRINAAHFSYFSIELEAHWMEEEELRQKICVKCDFYKEGEKLQCNAFKVNKKLIEEGKITLDEL